MADTEVAHEYSSKCLTKITQENNKNRCENCDKMKREHQKTLDELRSVKLSTELLWAEGNINITSEPKQFI
jgi:hypothetical protein